MGFDYKEFKKTKEQQKLGKEEKQEAVWMKWLKFGIVTALYLAFLYWVGSWMGLIVVPFIYDIYITKKIKWTWWKSLEGAGRTVMSWVDAIVFALVAVYFVNQFFFQNYQIPSSSLEKSLMTGDYLLVSKLSYGPRIPQTPLTMPLTQHTMPLFGTKSYFEWPHWDYRRVKGLGKVELGDIVVFNYPSGDTCCVQQSMDYYSLCYQLGAQNIIENGGSIPRADTLSTEDQMYVFNQIYEIGKKVVAANKATYGEVVSRPADRRENYVKRCVGLPGQTLQIKDKVIYVDGKAEKQPDNVQFNYAIYTRNNQVFSDEVCNELGISDEDRDKVFDRKGGMPLTQKALKALQANKDLVDSIAEIKDENALLYPLDHYYGWTPDNYGPVWIPAKGQSIDLNMENIAVYERPIRVYEENDLVIKDGKIYINGKESTKYTFKLDYYWMMGDNRHNSADSRYWGFVPEDHIVGKPLFIWLSVSPDANPASKIRWNRLFRWVDNIR